jgi:hypothetical protein
LVALYIFAHQQRRRTRVHGEVAIDASGRDLRDGIWCLTMRGIVDQHRDRTCCCFGLIKERRDRGYVRKITRDQDNPAALVLRVAGEKLGGSATWHLVLNLHGGIRTGSGFLEVVQDHDGTLGSKGARGGRTDAGVGTGDEYYLAGESRIDHEVTSKQ